MERILRINAKELKEKILAGERDFKSIALPEGADLSRLVPELNDYLKQQDLATCPLKFSGAKLIRVILPRIYLPYVIMSGADMSGADIRKARGLESAVGLDSVIFRETIVTCAEQRIIENARKNLKMFDVRLS